VKTIVHTDYVCECCGWKFDDEERCRKHEEEHAKVESAAPPMSYGCLRPCKQTKKYPEVVIVRMNDGVDIRYGILDENKSIAER